MICTFTSKQQYLDLILPREGILSDQLVESEDFQFLLAVQGERGVFFMWDGNDVCDLNVDTFPFVFEEAKKAGIKPPYVVYGSHETFHTLSRSYTSPTSVIFYKANARTGLDSLLPNDTKRFPVIPIVDELIPIRPEDFEDEVKPAKKRLAFVQARESIGKSQAGLADELGLSEIYIRKIEAGDKTPSRKTMMRIGQYLNKPVHELFPDVFLESDGLSVAR